MKTKLLVLVAFTALVAFAVQVGTAVAGSHTHAAFADITSDLKLRPGVAQFGGHPRVNPAGLYGAFDANYVPRTGKMAYSMRWKSLRGSALRLLIRSRATGAVYAVLCGPCRYGPAESGFDSRDGHPVTEAKGTVSITRDLAYLMVGGYTFLELDTTVFPSGEIGAPIYGRFFYPGQPSVKGDPRCC